MVLRASPIQAAVLAALCAAGVAAQVIVFESGGLRYQTLSKDGITVMFAMPPMFRAMRARLGCRNSW